MLARLRAVAFTTLLWAVAFCVVGVVYGLYRAWTMAPPDIPIGVARLRIVELMPLVFAAWGAISGAVFAILLSLAERRRSLADLSVVRTALWGAIGSGIAPAVILLVALSQTGWMPVIPSLVLVGVTATLGCVLAGGQLALARRAPQSLP